MYPNSQEEHEANLNAQGEYEADALAKTEQPWNVEDLRAEICNILREANGTGSGTEDIIDYLKSKYSTPSVAAAGKYKWEKFDNEYRIAEVGGDVVTLIAVTDSHEKAHLITTSLNSMWSQWEQSMREAGERIKTLKKVVMIQHEKIVEGEERKRQ